MQYLIISISVLVLSILLLKHTKRKNFALILLVSLLSVVLSIYIVLKLLIELEKFSDSTQIISLIIVYLVIPLLILYVVYRFLNNTKVMNTKEGRSMTAKLSALFGLNLLILIPLSFYLFVVDGLRFWGIYVNIFISIIILLDLLFSFYFLIYLIYSVFYQLVPVKDEIDYIIVLGSGLNKDKITPLLKSRVDKALEYYEKDNNIKIVVSGGQGEDELISEAKAMQNYLLSIGINEKSIILEDKSTSTYENLLFSNKLIMEDAKIDKPKMYFSTNNYHVLRAALYAGKLKLRIEGIGAPTAFYFLPSALLREYIALIVKYKVFTLINFIVVLIFVLISYGPY